MSANSFESAGIEERLINQLASEDKRVFEKAWSSVYKIHYPDIRDFITCNKGTRDDAFDIFQDTLTILLRNIASGNYREEATLGAYIFGISRNLWIKELQGRKKKSTITADALQAVTQNDYNYLMSIEVVGILIDELKEDCRRLLREFYYNSLNLEQLKMLFNVSSVQAVSNKKWRCLGYLTDLVKERMPTDWE